MCELVLRRSCAVLKHQPVLALRTKHHKNLSTWGHKEDILNVSVESENVISSYGCDFIK